jgi:hypothetical protein
MKAEKKHGGTKAQVRAMKEKERRIATAILLTIILLAMGLSAYFAYTLLTQSSRQSLIEPSLQFKPENPNPQLKAAIVDQLSLTLPNETFVKEAAAILTKANYTVDCFSGGNITVEFYKELPTLGYSLIILREHSTALNIEGQKFVSCPVYLFTNENYSLNAYLYEQLTDQLAKGSYTMPNPPYYFAIGPGFVTSSMDGRFQNTTIIMMGCQSMNNPTMAQAFVQKGAVACIGWNNSVSADRTDQATLYLLQHLITQKETIKQAVDDTMTQVGTDPQDKSLLAYYPLEAGEQTIENSSKN